MEDILSSSLQTLYEYTPITHSSANARFTYTAKSPSSPFSIVLQTPDTQPANWSLHASSIWVASIFIADHIHDLPLVNLCRSSDKQIRVLELGAGAGLPGILLAKTYGDAVDVTVSDYPDPSLITTLASNVERNGVSSNCRAVAYAWGSEPTALLGGLAAGEAEGYDLVLAADTLWNPDLHGLLLDTLRMTLRSGGRAQMVAGLHTGRYTLERFLQTAHAAGFVVDSVIEREVEGEEQRGWDVTRAENEDEKERRRWVLWMVLSRADV